MELITNPRPQSMIQDPMEIKNNHSSSFIEANTQKVSLQHLQNDCIIPVFSKDNETTISHGQFIGNTMEIVQNLFPEMQVNSPDIRVSHVVKGRIPSAIGKPAKELKEHEKTIYYERCAFLIDLPNIVEVINGNELSLSVGGVRAYNQENLYSRKSLEKFKVFIGFKNKVCTNLCISTDGFSNELRIGSIDELGKQMENLFLSYNRERHLELMQRMSRYRFTEKQFAHFLGRLRMYHHMTKSEQLQVFPIHLNDSQVSVLVKNYYSCPNFGRNKDGSIDFWKLFNLLTEANKSSYIDTNLERNVNVSELINNLGNSMENGILNWYTQ